MGIRDTQKEERKNEILGAALNLFVTRGYKATKITDIANEVHMSTGLLFHYFKSKEELYLELVKIGLMGTQMPLKANFDSPIMYFQAFAESLFSYMQKEPLQAKMFVLMADAQREGIPESVRNLALKVDTVKGFVPIIKMGQRDGSIKKGDPLAISNAFFCSIQGIMEQYALNPSMKLPEASWIVDIVRGDKT